MTRFERMDAELWLEKARETLAALDAGQPIMGAFKGDTSYYPSATGVLRAVTAGLATAVQKSLESRP
jgi:hypothetical protein